MSALPDAPGVMLASQPLIALRPLALGRAEAMGHAALPGGFATRRKGQGLEVAETRDYVAGDDVRHLDRSATARTGRLHVRQFQQDRDRVCLLVADMRRSMFWGLRRAFLSVAAAEALCLLGWQMVETGGRAGLLAITPQGPVIVAARGRVRGMLDVIGGLVEAHRRALETHVGGDGLDPPLDQALSGVSRLLPQGGEVVLASSFDLPGHALGERLSALGERRAVRLLQITDATDLPRGRYPVRLQDGRRLRLTLGDRALEHDSAEIAGHPADVLSASESVEALARRLMRSQTRSAA